MSKSNTELKSNTDIKSDTDSKSNTDTTYIIVAPNDGSKKQLFVSSSSVKKHDSIINGMSIFVITILVFETFIFCTIACILFIREAGVKEYKIVNNMNLQEIVIATPVTMNNENKNLNEQLTSNYSTANVFFSIINSPSQIVSKLGANNGDGRCSG
ncbi:23982_t:CDS:2, partial [Dentiscutata erythropus]